MCDALRYLYTSAKQRHSARRVGPHKEAEFSSQSIMKAMERFVDAVQDMETTILVPSRLMDLKVGDESDTIKVDSKPKDMSTDLYRLYTMVNCVKNELLWGNNVPLEEDEGNSNVLVQSSTAHAQSESTVVKGHARRPSTTSVASSQSVSMSDTDSETSNENDSGIEGETETRPDYVQTAEASFRRHLHGLQRSLAQMTSAAAYLTKRYQNDIGASV
uniref:Mid1-interacting protein 1 n=1 Tax=Lygus hesperus TaxID=30085 RepID=A0A146M960_LYGHE